MAPKKKASDTGFADIESFMRPKKQRCKDEELPAAETADHADGAETVAAESMPHGGETQPDASTVVDVENDDIEVVEPNGAVEDPGDELDAILTPTKTFDELLEEEINHAVHASPRKALSAEGDQLLADLEAFLDEASAKPLAKAKAKAQPKRRMAAASITEGPEGTVLPEPTDPAVPAVPAIPAVLAVPAVPALAVVSSGAEGMFRNMRPLCGKCNVEVDPFKAQLKSKAAGRFICNVCNTKSVMFHRTLGAWPVPEFKELSDADQLSFWQEARDKKNGEQLKSLLIDTLVSKRVDKVTARVAGTYLPLTVYKTQGFDVDLISAKCNDTQEHPILGTTYRVALSSLSRESVEEKQRVQVMEMLRVFKDASSSKEPEALSKGSRSSSSAAARLAERLADANAEAIIDDKSSDEDSSDSSSSSSSSSDKKKRRRIRRRRTTRRRARRRTARKRTRRTRKTRRMPTPRRMPIPRGSPLLARRRKPATMRGRRKLRGKRS